MYTHFLKRFINIVLSAIGIVVLGIPMIIIALVIKKEDPGPALFKQKRVGLHKSHFNLLKFRSMRIDTPHDIPTHQLENPDQYLLKCGKILRKYSLDELPQLFNIFMGQMSIIGPRPALWNQYDLIEERDKYGANDVKPGLTGWAQINGRDELEIPVKAKFDGEYVERQSFLFDCKCFFGTIGKVLHHEGVVEGGTGEIAQERRKTKTIMDQTLQNKKILFMSPAFFNYEHIIKNKMEQMGATVFFYNERSVKSAFDRALLKINPKIFHRKSNTYFKQIIDENLKNDFDYILIIKCDMVSYEMVNQFKKAFPHAKVCLHIWDSIKNIPGIEKKIPYFHFASSNDRMDCINYKELFFRPLFYSDAFCKENCDKKEYKYDVSFCGTIHSDRYEILKKIKARCEKKQLVFFMFPYLQSKFIYGFYKITKKSFRGTSQLDFSFIKRSHEEIADIESSSKAIIDIQHPAQSGLTMRTIEMIGMRKKIITTNKDIVNYDLYDETNICVIDRNNPVIDDNFIAKPYKELSKEIYRKYSLEQWILDVLGIGGQN